MKKRVAKSGKINKGAPSGFIISMIVHAVAFFLAGLFVVFTVLPKEPPAFTPPPAVERPKMKLKKPKVKVRKSSQPKPSSRIVAKVKTASMPEIQLPDLMGTGEGLLGGTGIGGDFLDMPDLGQMSIFGSDATTGNDLVGTFYDFKRTSDGRLKVPGYTDVDIIVHDFMKKGWKTSSLSKFYRSPTKLYASTICIPTVQSTLAPEAFGEYQTEGWAWAVLYRGKLVYPKDIKFRFWGVGDKFMAVRVDGKVVLVCAYNTEVRDLFSDIWTPRAPNQLVYPMGEHKASIGDWIELKAGVPVDMEVILGERQGGLVYMILCVEVEGEKYPRNPFGGGPTLPVFKTDMLPRGMIDQIYVDLYPGDACLTNNLVFCDYEPKPIILEQPPETNEPPVLVKDAVKKLRTWTSTSGSTMEGKFLTNMGDYILVENAEKKQIKLPIDQLSADDQTFIGLALPPEFRIEFSKRSNQVPLTTLSPYDNDRPLSIFDFTFGAKVRQYSTGTYNHKVNIEYFAVGSEVNGNNYVLLDRQSSSYIPTKENKFSHEFYGNKVRLREYANRATATMRGVKYGGYLVILTDETGRLIQYDTSNEFLFRNLANLGKLPLHAHFDKYCNRVYPPRPVDADRGPGAL